jgi:5-oxoprolinase (ATP-hydrolysing) subunit A
MTLRLNADVGELPARVHGDDEAAVIALLDEANIACGGHAGDDDTMRITVARCLAHGVTIGAHPSYPDREHFGRRRLALDDDTLRRALLLQVQTLVSIAAAAGGRVAFLKPHGALYHAVDDDPAVAAVLADVVDVLEPVIGVRLPVVLLHARGDDTPSRRLLRARGVTVRGEVFADRGTDAAGLLLPRGVPGAELDEGGAVATVARLLHDGSDAATLCLHGDGPHALTIARAVRALLERGAGGAS